MQMIQCTQWGPPEELKLVEAPDPTPGPGQAVVEVSAAGVNFVDALFVAGTYQIKVPPPFTPGSELAGTVSAVGDGVTQVAVGDRVLASTGIGAYASHALVEAPDPTPGPGQAVVEVSAAGVNFVDALFVAGTYQIKVPPPFTPGSELAGTVSAVGDGVTQVAVGDRVLASTGIGAYASHALVAANALTPVPDALGLASAAALVQSYCTAWFALTRRTSVAEGERVLVLGAGGGVGLAAIDVARSMGAEVIAAASTPEKLADATAMGAAATIAYETEDLKARARELSDGGVDVVIDPVGGPHTEPALRAMGLGGRLVIIGFAAGDIPRVPVNQVLLNNRSVVGVDWGAWAMKHPTEQATLLDEVLAAVAAGTLHPSAPSERPLSEAGAVLRDLLERRLRGKTVLVPG